MFGMLWEQNLEFPEIWKFSMTFRSYIRLNIQKEGNKKRISGFAGRNREILGEKSRMTSKRRQRMHQSKQRTATLLEMVT